MLASKDYQYYLPMHVIGWLKLKLDESASASNCFWRDERSAFVDVMIARTLISGSAQPQVQQGCQYDWVSSAWLLGNQKLGRIIGVSSVAVKLSWLTHWPLIDQSNLNPNLSWLFLNKHPAVMYRHQLNFLFEILEILHGVAFDILSVCFCYTSINLRFRTASTVIILKFSSLCVLSSRLILPF